jgi:hypothetical protein
VKVRRSLLKDAVSVATYSGEGAYGPVLAPTVTVRCNVDGTRRLVRASDGSEVVSEATLIVHPDDGGLFTPESLVGIAGRASSVITATPKTLRGKTSHVLVACR